MNPLFVQFLGSLVRWAMTILFSWLVYHGVIEKTDADVYLKELASASTVLWLVGLLAPLAWGLWAKYASQLKFLTGLTMHPGTTEQEVKDKISAGGGVQSTMIPPTEPPIPVPADPKKM